MGYELSAFVDTVANEFICPICLMVVESPLLSPCEHIFCAKCIITWTRSKFCCPVDRQVLYWNSLAMAPRYYRNLWGQLKVKCQFVDKVIRLSSVNCSNLSQNHVYKKSRRLIVVHLEVFEKRLKQLRPSKHSTGCTTILSLENLENHLITCAYRPEVIVVCDKGCNLSVSRLEYQKSCFEHLSANLAAKHEKEIDEMKKQIEQLNDQVKLQRATLKKHLTRTSGAPPKLTWNRLYNMKLLFNEPNVLEPLTTNRFCFAYVQFAKLAASATILQIHVLNINAGDIVVIGLTQMNHSDEPPGRLVGSIGYYSRGEVMVNGVGKFDSAKWKKGDIIECCASFQNDSGNAGTATCEVRFTLNQATVAKKMMKVPIGGFYPTIRMGSFSNSIPKVEYLNF